MSTDAITMQDLELEHAELLPSRETLNCWRTSPYHSSSVTQVGYGNTAGNQDGLINVNALNGSLDNWFSLGSGTVIG